MNKSTLKAASSHGNENSSKGTRVRQSNGKHSVNLQKRGSTRFQFGLILAMAVVYLCLEASFESIKPPEVEAGALGKELVEYHSDANNFEVEKTKKIKVEAPKTRDPKFKIVKDDVPVPTTKEFINVPEEAGGPDLVLGSIAYDPDPDVIEDIMFILVEDAPIYPGCENVEKDQRLACFTTKIQNHIQRNFRYPELAQELNIQGKVYVGFKIDTKGNISNIQLRGPHKLLVKESERIIGKLPKMTPGKQRGVPVNVPFSIPINFKLH